MIHPTTADDARLELEYRGERHAVRRPRLSGYAAVYNAPRQMTPRIAEVVRPGAFDRALEQRQVVIATWEHAGGVDERGQLVHPEWVFASSDIEQGEGSLRLESDARGLRFEAEPLATDANAGWLRGVEKGLRRGSSFAFVARDAPIVKSGQGDYVREIRDVELLLDVSNVRDPAFPEATTEVRGNPLGRLAFSAATIFEAALRSHGLTPDEISGILALEHELDAIRSHSGAPPRRGLELCDAELGDLEP